MCQHAKKVLLPDKTHKRIQEQDTGPELNRQNSCNVIKIKTTDTSVHLWGILKDWHPIIYSVVVVHSCLYLGLLYGQFYS